MCLKIGQTKMCFLRVTISLSSLLFVCLIVFTSDYHTFCSRFKVKRHVIGCTNHDIVVGLCSDIFMRLSYYIHLGYGKKFSARMGIEPIASRLLYPKTRAVPPIQGQIFQIKRKIKTSM